MKRRGFFQSLAKAAAIIALAPQLAFRAKAEVFTLDATKGSLTRASIQVINPGELADLFKVGDKVLLLDGVRAKDMHAHEVTGLATFGRRLTLHDYVLAKR